MTQACLLLGKVALKEQVAGVEGARLCMHACMPAWESICVAVDMCVDLWEVLCGCVRVCVGGVVCRYVDLCMCILKKCLM